MQRLVVMAKLVNRTKNTPKLGGGQFDAGCPKTGPMDRLAKDQLLPRKRMTQHR